MLSTLRPAIYAAALAAPMALTSGLAAKRAAEPPRALTAADYARAEKFMTYNTTPLVLHSASRTTWIDDDRFWYVVRTENGVESVLVDAGKRTRGACDLPACRAAEREAARAGGGGRGGANRFDAPSPD